MRPAMNNTRRTLKNKQENRKNFGANAESLLSNSNERLAQILTKYSIQEKSIKILSNYINQKFGGFGKPDAFNGTPWSATCAIVSGPTPWPIKAILRKDGCLAAISERPTDFTDNNKWNEMDENAIADLHLALADEVLSSIEEKKTAKEIWDHLTKLYEAKSLHNKIFLKRKLYSLRMSESTSVTEHLNMLNTLFSQFTSLSYKIEPQERAELLLQSLPDSYDQLIINLTNNILADHLVFDDVAAAILEEENRCKNKEDRQGNMQQAEALTVMRERSTERGQSSSHNHGRSKSRSKKNLKCYNCGKKGHLKKDCWSLPKNSNPQGNITNTSDDGDVLCCEASTTTEGRNRFADIWLIDSGATYYMTSRREWFHNYEPISGTVAMIMPWRLLALEPSN
ncbi:hypothetical protein GQ457_16G004330 [Hibiscus cannabinus]